MFQPLVRLDSGPLSARPERSDRQPVPTTKQYEAEAAGLLLEKGAGVNARTLSGRTALMEAIDGPKEFDNDHHRIYSPAIAKLLIAAGADVNARDAAGHPPLGLALQHGYADMADQLRSAGAKD